MYTSLEKTIGGFLQESYSISTEVVLTIPDDMEHGDITTNICMQVAPKLSLSPRDLAEKLIECIKKENTVLDAQIAGPGFVNITLTNEARLTQLKEAWGKCRPQNIRTNEAPVIVEYSHPNIAKPLGVHHILSTVLGQAIANLNRHLGYNTISWNYIGDWGTQFGKLAVAYEKWGGGKDITTYTLNDLLDLYVKFHDEAEDDATLEDAGRAAFRRLEDGETDIQIFWKEVVQISKKALDELYDRLHVSFDITKGESAYENSMDAIIEEGKKKGVFTEGESGSLIAQFAEDTNLPVCLILKADGGTLYVTRDLALAKDRKETQKPQAVLHVVDVAQQLHFQQVFKIMELLGWEMDHEEHVVYGRMSFPDKSMSTRKGNILRLDDALDEAVRRADALIEGKDSDVTGEERTDLANMIGTGAFVYSMLNQHRKHNIVFTWEKALSFEGNSGPYLQYTHARARSVLTKAAISSPELPQSVKTLEGGELKLLRRLVEFPTVLEDARRESMPHKLTNFLYVLCQDYNAFYAALPILKADEEAKPLRLALCAATADVLKCGAEILTLRVPNRM